jgi:hypothetical protein
MYRKLLKMAKKLFAFFLFFSLLFCWSLSGVKTQAAAQSSLSDEMTHQKKSVDSNHSIVFTTPTGVSAGQTMVVTFPADFSTTSVDYTDIDVADDGVDLVLGSSASGITWGAVFGGTGLRTLTITSGTGTIAATSVVAIEIGTNATSDTTGDQAINNATTANSFTISITAGNGADSGNIGITILDDDQIAVSATTDPSVSLSISDLVIGFGSFISTNIRYATSDAAGSATEPVADNPTKLIADTNAGNGLSINIYDEGNGTNPGLWSSAVSELIASDTSRNIIIVGLKKKYGAYGKNASGLTIHENFDNDAVDSALSRSAQLFATTAAPVSSGSVDLALVAAVDGATKAGNYIDTITVTCTGNF